MTNVTNQTWVFTPTIEICFIIQGSVISMTILFTQIIVIGKSYFGERHKSLVNVMSIGGRAQNLFGGGGGGKGGGGCHFILPKSSFEEKYLRNCRRRWRTRKKNHECVPTLIIGHHLTSAALSCLAHSFA